MQSIRKPQACKSSGAKSPQRCIVFASFFLFKHLFILRKEFVVTKPLFSFELKLPFKGKEQMFSIVKDSLELEIGCVTYPALTVQLRLGNNEWLCP